MSDVFPPPAAFDGVIAGSFNEKGEFIHVLHDNLVYGGGCLETIVDYDGAIYTRFVVCGGGWRPVWFETEDTLSPKEELW